MAVVNEIKCARCDRKYSGVRSRCPYCGARRIGRGKYSEDSDNARGKMLISVLIMAVFTVGAAILLFSTPGDVSAQDPVEPPGLSSPDDDVHALPPIVEPTPDPTPDPTPVIKLTVTSLTITYEGRKLDNEITVRRNEKVGLRVQVEPPEILEVNNLDIEWSTSNEDQFIINPVLINGYYYGVDVTGVSSDRNTTATLTVTVGDPDNGGMSETLRIRGGAER